MKTLFTTKFPKKHSKPKSPARSTLALFVFAAVLAACANPTAAPSQTPPSQPPTLTRAPAATAPPNTRALATPTPESKTFDGKHAYDEYLMAQLAFGARPAGSVALRATGDYILQELQKNGWQTETQEFKYRNIPIRNLIAKTNVGQGPIVILGAHYDTRARAEMDKTNPDAPIPGANDGASGAAVLLELSRALDKPKLQNEVWLAFFDAEDNGKLTACDLRVVPQQEPTALCDTNTWNWSVGAEHLAASLPTKPAAVIVLDMIGDANQDIYYEHNSDKQLQETLWTIAAELGYRQWFITEFKWSMSDDHTPFLQRNIRAIDIIDFDYPSWHTTQDTADKVSAASLERVGRVIETWLEEGAIER